MFRINFIRCLTAFISAGCLFIILILILIGLLSKKVIESNPLLSDTTLITQGSHVKPQPKQKLMVVGLISDTESDFENTQKALDYFKKAKVDMVIHLGDMTSLGVEEDFKRFYDLFKDSGLEFYSVPGDRDLWKSHGMSNFQKFFGDGFNVIKYDNVKLLLINNADEYSKIDNNQWQFISNNIKDSDFVFFHNPIFNNKSFILGSKGMGDYDLEVDEQRKELLKLVRSNKVLSTFAGDQHVFSESVDTEKPSLNHYVIGSANSKRAIGHPSFSLLTIYIDKDYYVQKLSIN